VIRGAAEIVDVPGSGSAEWSAFAALYHAAFPPGEREPDRLVAARLDAGRYRIRISRSARGHVTGGYVVDRVTEHDYALLCYVAVAAAWRKAGIGRRLCADAVTLFRGKGRPGWLLVEAKPRAARLYRRCGFARLDLDYRVPFHDGPGEQRMVLLALHRQGAPSRVARRTLVAMIRDLYLDGYLVAEDDPRLRDQLARIPDEVMVEDAPIPAAG